GATLPSGIDDARNLLKGTPRMSKHSRETPGPGEDHSGQGPAEVQAPRSPGSPGLEPAGDDLSRRDFLQQAGAGGLAVAVGAAALAPSQGADAEPARSAGTGTIPVTLQINGRKHELKLDPRVTLLDALREYLG